MTRRAELHVDGIPFVLPPALPDGLHVAPHLTWDGTPELWVIRDGELIGPPLRLEAKSPLTHDDTDYSPAALAVYHRPWTRGVYRLPFLQLRQQKFVAVDSAGRAIGVQTLSRSASRDNTEGAAVELLRHLLAREDPITRKRPPGEKRF